MDVITQTLGHRPGKVIAVHLSYQSRAEQRGRTPAHPSYFLKTSTSLASPGEIARPKGTELLGFEGEIAVVIGTAARNVSPEVGWSHVGWITAANDLALHDMRYADKGSNVRSKGGDGYTPVGPTLIPADQVAPDAIGIRTHLDGTLVQDDSSGGMLFPIADVIADLSRFMTLEVGDVILTGTPAGASVAAPGQQIDVEVYSLTDPTITSGRLTTQVVAGPPLADWGSPPRVDNAQRADAWGTNQPAWQLTKELRERLASVAVATLSAQLLKRGYDEVSIDGVQSLTPGRRSWAGPAPCAISPTAKISSLLEATDSTLRNKR